MAQRSITPEILAVLEPWLDSRMKEWGMQPEGRRAPTLPSTIDSKVNVREITRALGLRQSSEQHFYKKVELRTAINAVAEIQGLHGIGSRGQMDEADKVVADRLDRVQRNSSELSRVLAEREAVIERQRREITALKEQLSLRNETGMTLRDQPVVLPRRPADG